MITDIKQQLYRALIAANEYLHADYVIDSMTDIEIYSNLFLTHYKIYRVKHFVPTNLILFYFGFAPNKPVYSLVGNPKAFRDLVKADQVKIETPEVAVNYISMLVCISYSFLLSSSCTTDELVERRLVP